MKILILGVGNAQVDAIDYLKKEGHFVYGLSYKNEGSGKALVDQFDVINIIDKELVLDYVKKYGIQLIYSVGSDIAMPTIGYVSQRLKLPYFVNEETAVLMQNKFKFRSFLKTNNIPTIQFRLIKNKDHLSAWNYYPAIIKPVDSQGQRGVYKVNNINDIDKYYEKSMKYSPKRNLIIEEFISGNEFSINLFIENKKPIYTFISDRRVLNDKPGGIVCGHDMPSTVPEKYQESAINICMKTIKKLNIDNGPVYFQMKYNKFGVHIIEATPRLDGCHLWKVIKYHSTIDFLDLTFNLLIKKKNIYVDVLKNKTNNITIDFHLQEPNSLFKENNFNLETKAFLENKFYYKSGETVNELNGFSEKVGYMLY